MRTPRPLLFEMILSLTKRPAPVCPLLATTASKPTLANAAGHPLTVICAIAARRKTGHEAIQPLLTIGIIIWQLLAEDYLPIRQGLHGGMQPYLPVVALGQHHAGHRFALGPCRQRVGDLREQHSDIQIFESGRRHLHTERLGSYRMRPPIAHQQSGCGRDETPEACETCLRHETTHVAVMHGLAKSAPA